MATVFLRFLFNSRVGTAFSRWSSLLHMLAVLLESLPTSSLLALPGGLVSRFLHSAGGWLTPDCQVVARGLPPLQEYASV